MQISILNSLNDPAVRDLAWAIGSPGLADAMYPPYRGRVVDDAWCKLQLEKAAARLLALDNNPQTLHDHIAARPTRRLGHYFETLISYWLTQMAGARLIATNLQVRHGQHTLGEYDFLFRDACGDICHWETAVKFYLQREPAAEQRAFIGPGTRDRLDLKLDKIFQQQLVLGNTDPGRKSLPGGLKLDRAEAFIKGYLFYHISTAGQFSIPGISSTHQKGWWMRHAVEKLPQTAAGSRWIILPRMRWLAPVRLDSDTPVMTLEEANIQLNNHFKSHKDALLLCEMQAAACGWQEISRGFAVCSTWPLIAEKTAIQPAP